jgi:hypothetical protein
MGIEGLQDRWETADGEKAATTGCGSEQMTGSDQ